MRIAVVGATGTAGSRVVALGEGALLAPADATMLGPTDDGWLDTLDRRPPRRTDGGG